MWVPLVPLTCAGALSTPVHGRTRVSPEAHRQARPQDDVELGEGCPRALPSQGWDARLAPGLSSRSRRTCVGIADGAVGVGGHAGGWWQVHIAAGASSLRACIASHARGKQARMRAYLVLGVSSPYCVLLNAMASMVASGLLSRVLVG